MSKESGCSHITVVIPTLNEEQGIGSTILELQEVLRDTHYLVVDGNSEDKTAKIASLLNAEVVQQDGVGKGRAIAHALEYINPNTEYVVFIDGDFTYPAEYVSMMIEILDEDPEVGMVCGNRFNSHFKLRGMGNAYYLGNRLIALIHRWLNGPRLRDPLTGLRAIRWECLKEWKPASESFDIEVELNQYICKKMYDIVEIPINYRDRRGDKKLGLRHGFTILRRIVLQILK